MDPGFFNIPEYDVNTYIKSSEGFIPGINTEQVTNHYNQWSNTYEKDLTENVYRGPKLLANLCEIFISDKSARILDVAAGTGLVGKHLAEKGYKNIDALEPAEKMVEVAREKNVYTNFYLEYIYADRQTSIPANTYDGVLVMGAFCEGHIPAEGIRELIRVVKPGGYIINVMRKEFLDYVKDYAGRLEPFMDKLEKEENVWSLVTKFDMNNYFSNKVGKAFVFRKN